MVIFPPTINCPDDAPEYPGRDGPKPWRSGFSARAVSGDALPLRVPAPRQVSTLLGGAVSTKVEKTIDVAVPVPTAYNQWTQFEDFPKFMGGVHEVRQLNDRTLHWVAKIAGVEREWDATILEQTPDQKIAWAATTGATNAGAVYFQPIGPDRTAVRLSLEYEPEGLVEKTGDFFNVVARQAEKDLEKFKEYIEGRGAETGSWRGSVNEPGSAGTPGVEDASTSRGDSGKPEN
jgi:uncharacterized membrane protein